jgi:hypothetical protein
MAECARPLQYAANIVGTSMHYLGIELSSAWGVPVLGVSCSECVLSPPTEPHTVFLASTKQFTWLMKNGGLPISTALSHDEVVRLQTEPEWRDRWVETWVSLEPLLKKIEDIVCTKAHLAEPIKLNSAMAKLPFTELGCGWEEAFMSAGAMCQIVVVWTRQWCAASHCPTFRLCHGPPSHRGAGRRESLRIRWARDEYDQLQPTAPGLVMAITNIAMVQAASCGVRETQLQVQQRMDVTCSQPQTKSQIIISRRFAIPGPKLVSRETLLARPEWI